MKKINVRFLYVITLLGVLTTLIINGFISTNPKPFNMIEKNDDIPMIFQISAETPTYLWNTTWGGSNNDFGQGITVDSTGNIYCSGRTNSFGEGNFDFALVKYDSEGNKLWNTTWGGSDNDYGQDLMVGTSGNIYYVGYTYSYGSDSADVALVKFASNGTKLWNITWGGSDVDYGMGIDIDASGFIYCSGNTRSFGNGESDMLLIKFDPNGTKLWNTTWGGAEIEYGYHLTADSGGFIYCAGSTASFGAGDEDLALVKFSSNGVKIWNNSWGGINEDRGYGVALDTTGSVYCSGHTLSFGAGGEDMALVKFEADGTKLWNTTWGGSNSERGRGVKTDSSGMIYCTGFTVSFGPGASDFALVQYANNGTKLWNTTWGGVVSDTSSDIAIFDSNSLYCFGNSLSYSVGSNDFALVKYNIPTDETDQIPGFQILYLLISLFLLICVVYIINLRKINHLIF